MEIKPRFFQGSQQSYFLFGPRGTGKSTWLRYRYPQAHFVDLLDPEVFRAYSAKPERLREVVEALAPGTTVIVDEIQKLPQLLDVVHLLLENKEARHYILTGSSSRKLRRSGVDLLAGRALVRTLHPFMASELGKAFSLENALAVGLIPLVVDSPNPQETIRSYAAVYLKEEVQSEGIVRSIGGFSRFLESISFSHGAVLNISDVARDCQVERKTAEGYVSILEDLLLAYRLPVFTKRAKRNLSSHPKFYYFDSGVFRSIRPTGPLDSPQEIEGAALEGLVAQHLRAWNAYSGDKNTLFFWRTKSGNEVDFIVYGAKVFLALEVKNTSRVSTKMLQGLLAFREDYPEAQTLFLYRGKERLKIKGVLCLPVQEFLLNLKPHKPLWE